MIYSITTIPSRYQETDKMGVIYHGNYATWFEVARTDYILKLGLNYTEMEKAGVVSPVTVLHIDYVKSVTYPNVVRVKTWVSSYSRIRSRYQYEIYNEDDEVVTKGYTDNICIQKDSFKPIRLDRYFPEWHRVYAYINQKNKEGVDFEVVDGIDIEQ
ncbi:1,4-dihydroxy-2-naphthoyl-CoA hydrolase MenI [Staphylococcus massiliensis]|uniref:Putative thioesterase superfamily protein n=1 Tax=Staphylococcus massiliensis S46 TaxID=1229783 RepID=K9AZW0_9STAP|nr:thioesterase family protein [Staphylococcus massiliensis]EKU47065.1 putative thioesterase superfamily protein [Staphylococcus massiliensis S46]MCG3398643.1 acyl-CoA thioesterase [Staphylococcus massiliensis]MCG3401205.1 acyl-CoA thioesterase [Staphylococcus massiliensis]MCG3412618.1 acyl-CoA thioesterase [Staphylococcus massiliensis]POA00801.1 acyl-CoA thioesterase [Staphylococcus massiliensis CCUG 55927]